METARRPGLNVSGQEQDSQRRMNDTRCGNLLAVPVLFLEIDKCVSYHSSHLFQPPLGAVHV